MDGAVDSCTSPALHRPYVADALKRVFAVRDRKKFGGVRNRPLSIS